MPCSRISNYFNFAIFKSKRFDFNIWKFPEPLAILSTSFLVPGWPGSTFLTVSGFDKEALA